MAIGYTISAHKSPAQLLRLVDRLNEPDAFFAIHIDARSAPHFGDAVSRLSGSPNVAFLPAKRFRYRSFDHVTVSLSGLSALMTSRVPLEHVVLLTAQDYPIKPVAFIRSFLALHEDKSFLATLPLPSPWWAHGGLDRYQCWHFFVLDWHFQLPMYSARNRYKRKFPSGFRPYGGGGYWILARNAVEYILDFVRTHPQFVRFFRFVDVPDELFFQTILMNSPLRPAIINRDLRYAKWDKPNTPHPAILTLDDFDRLSSTEAIFARKFDASVDSRVLDLIDERLLQPARSTTSGLVVRDSSRHDAARHTCSGRR